MYEHDYLFTMPGSHIQMVAPTRSGKSYINSMYGKAFREMDQRISAYDINGALVWELMYSGARWLGTSYKSGGFSIHQSRDAGIEFYMADHMFPATDKIQGTNEYGKPFTVLPGQFMASTLTGWIAGQINRA